MNDNVFPYRFTPRYRPAHVSGASLHGFSLLEVLVALVIVAIALGTTLRTARDRTETLDALRQRTLARWVAQNQLANLERSPQLTATTTSGEDIQAGQRFQWSAQINTPRQNTGDFPVIVTITGANAAKLATQHAWIAQPQDINSQTSSSGSGTSPNGTPNEESLNLRGPHNEHLFQ